MNLNGQYLDGLSLTHGPDGNREHIWSFAAALYEYNSPRDICPCTTDQNWPYTVPEFIGNNYFCETGDPDSPWVADLVYPDDPLWDGKQCGHTSTCCEFNNPPWFCTPLPRPTNDSLEMRNCANEGPANENVIVSRVEIYGAYSNIEY